MGDPARSHLASALADLADDLLAADRVDEAEAATAEAAAMVLDWSGRGFGPVAGRGDPCSGADSSGAQC